MAKSRKMKFKIKGTSFTTVTTNVNALPPKIHKDKGDDEEGFGNLAVIENGEYSGGGTCLPQYGVGFDVRSGDVLFMDVHEMAWEFTYEGNYTRCYTIVYSMLSKNENI